MLAAAGIINADTVNMNVAAPLAKLAAGNIQWRNLLRHSKRQCAALHLADSAGRLGLPLIPGAHCQCERHLLVLATQDSALTSQCPTQCKLHCTTCTIQKHSYCWHRSILINLYCHSKLARLALT